jgi:ParB-like chromosome segregation protein Spo0J
MQVHIFSVDRLIPYRGNPRKNDHAIDRMASPIQEFGFKIPTLARSRGEVVDGVPVILCDGLMRLRRTTA